MKFIKLTDVDGDVAYINVEMITSVFSTYDGTARIFDVGGRYSDVMESVNEVMKLISEVEHGSQI